MIMLIKSMILSTQLSWDQQSDKNISNSTDARAHSNELRIKVLIIMMIIMVIIMMINMEIILMIIMVIIMMIIMIISLMIMLVINLMIIMMINLMIIMMINMMIIMKIFMMIIMMVEMTIRRLMMMIIMMLIKQCRGPLQRAMHFLCILFPTGGSSPNIVLQRADGRLVVDQQKPLGEDS